MAHARTFAQRSRTGRGDSAVRDSEAHAELGRSMNTGRLWGRDTPGSAPAGPWSRCRRAAMQPTFDDPGGGMRLA